jgi:hypothetical protein
MKKHFIIEITFEQTDKETEQKIIETTEDVFNAVLKAAVVQGLLAEFKIYDTTEHVPS